MIEQFPSHSAEESREQWKSEYIAFAKAMQERQERYPFPGIHREAYEKIRADEERYPGYSTPIDELIARFQAEGAKVVLGKHPESGNVFILPGSSDDIEQDSIFPRHLKIVEGMDDALRKLIEMNSQ